MTTSTSSAAAIGLPTFLFDRRRILLGLAAASTAAAVPITQAAAGSSLPLLPKAVASEPSDLMEVIAIYKDLNAERQTRMLAGLRDSLTAQRIIARIETAVLS